MRYGARCAVVRRSSLYSSECNQTSNRSPLPPRALLVTGTGSSGTKWLAAVLQRLGANISHDGADLGANGAVSWPQAFNDLPFGGKARGCLWPRFAFGHANATRHALFRHVMHLIREPLGSINARFDLGTRRAKPRWYKEPTECNAVVDPPPPKLANDTNAQILRLTLIHWVLWNSFAEAVAERHLRVEALTGRDILLALDAAGIRISKPTGEVQRAMTAARAFRSNHEHTSKGAPLTWARMASLDPTMAALAQMVALRHGYEIGEGERLPALSPGYGLCAEQQCGFDHARGGRWTCAIGVVKESDLEGGIARARPLDSIRQGPDP